MKGLPELLLEPTVLLSAALAYAVAVIWSGVDEFVAQRKQMLAAMQRFGEAFVREFERPLIQYGDTTRPIQSQLRVNVHRGTLEILIAPARGRRYPNLSDHRRNVEYDVARVLQRLRNHPFVSGPLYAQGDWVVVPFVTQVSASRTAVKALQ
jgi:hypothetical protein